MKSLINLIAEANEEHGTIILVDMYRLLALSDDDRNLYMLHYSNHTKDGVVADFKIDKRLHYELVKEEDLNV